MIWRSIDNREISQYHTRINFTSKKVSCLYLLIDWLPIFHNNVCISPESSWPFLFASQTRHTATRRTNTQHQMIIQHYASIRNENVWKNSIYHSLLLCSLITVTCIKTTCPLSMIWPCTKAKPAITCNKMSIRFEMHRKKACFSSLLSFLFMEKKAQRMFKTNMD